MNPLCNNDLYRGRFEISGAKRLFSRESKAAAGQSKMPPAYPFSDKCELPLGPEWSAPVGRHGWLMLFALSVTASMGFAVNPEQTMEHTLELAVTEYQAALDCSDRAERLQRFHRAEMLFSRAIDGGEPGAPDGVQNAELYVNMGNAALGAERLGPAILAFRRSLEIDPDHARASQNLAHVRSLLPDWVPRPEQAALLDSFFSWGGRLSHSERQALAGLLFLVAAALLAASIRWQRRSLRNLVWLPAIAWLIVVASLTAERWRASGSQAVIVAAEVTARAADSAHAPARFSQSLPGGTEVEELERRDTWSRIRLADGREAWVPASAIARVE